MKDTTYDPHNPANYFAALMSQLGWAIRGAASQAIFEGFGEQPFDGTAMAESKTQTTITIGETGALVLRLTA